MNIYKKTYGIYINLFAAKSINDCCILSCLHHAKKHLGKKWSGKAYGILYSKKLKEKVVAFVKMSSFCDYFTNLGRETNK